MSTSVESSTPTPGRGRATPNELASRISALFSDDHPPVRSHSINNATTAVPTPNKDMNGFDLHRSGARSTPKVDDEEAETAINQQQKLVIDGAYDELLKHSVENDKSADPHLQTTQATGAVPFEGSAKDEETDTTSQTTALRIATSCSKDTVKPKPGSTAHPPHRRSLQFNENENFRRRDTHSSRGEDPELYSTQHAQRLEKHYDPQTVRVPLSLLKQLQYKAQLYDRLVAPSAPSPASEKGNAVSNLPPAQTLTIKGLPRTLNLADMIHSINAPGGVRYIRVIEDSHAKSSIAVVTFSSVSTAEAYARYVAQCGFFMSQRVTEDTPPGPGETLLGIQLGGQSHGNQGGIKRFWVLKTHIPGVELVLPSNSPSYMSDDTHINDIDAEIKAGATRCVRFKSEAKDVARELEMFAEGAAVVVEGLSYFQSQKDGQVTIVRFGGIGDAIIVRRYFGLRKGWEGRVEGAKDVCDKSVESLGWENLNRVEGKRAAWVGGEGQRSNLIEFSATAGSRSDLIDMSSRVSDV